MRISSGHLDAQCKKRKCSREGSDDRIFGHIIISSIIRFDRCSGGQGGPAVLVEEVHDG
jgi:hypothetical protein